MHSEYTNLFKKRVLFVGMPDTAYTTLHALNKAGVNIIAVVAPHKGHPVTLPFAHFANKLGYKVIIPEKNINEVAIIEKIKNINADIAVVTSYSQRINPELLNIPKDGFINVHPSLLPEYRGPNPYSHVIMNNEAQTGVTIHKMDENFDTGEILMQDVINIQENDTLGTLFNKLNRLSSQLLIQFLIAYEKNGLPNGFNQKKLKKPKHYAQKIVPESDAVTIKWNNSAEYIERFIRALNPFLPACTTYKGFSVKIFSAETEKTNIKYNKKDYGVICNIGNTIDVITQNGILKIRSLQLGNFFIGDAKDFSSRIKIQVGDKFE